MDAIQTRLAHKTAIAANIAAFHRGEALQPIPALDSDPMPDGDDAYAATVAQLDADIAELTASMQHAITAKEEAERQAIMAAHMAADEEVARLAALDQSNG